MSLVGNKRRYFVTINSVCLAGRTVLTHQLRQSEDTRQKYADGDRQLMYGPEGTAVPVWRCLWQYHRRHTVDQTCKTHVNIMSRSAKHGWKWWGKELPVWNLIPPLSSFPAALPFSFRFFPFLFWLFPVLRVPSPNPARGHGQRWELPRGSVRSSPDEQFFTLPVIAQLQKNSDNQVGLRVVTVVGLATNRCGISQKNSGGMVLSEIFAVLYRTTSGSPAASY